MEKNETGNSEFKMLEKHAEVQYSSIQKRIEITEKRIDDVKYYIGGVVTIIVALSFFFGYNYNNEKQSLRDFEKNLREELGRTQSTPDIQILNMNGEDINGTTVKAMVTFDNNWKIYVPHIIRNNGLGSTGPIWSKLYTKDPLIMKMESTDEKDFEYELLFTPKDADYSDFPGNFTIQYDTYFFLKNTSRPPSGIYPVLEKYFYGNGKVFRCMYKILIP